MLSTVPVGLAQFLTSSETLSVFLGFFTMFFASVYVAPTMVAAQSLVQAHIRGVTAAVMLLVPTVFGVGLGPFLTGAASDLFAKQFNLGNPSLRYALSIALASSVLGGLLLLRLADDIPEPNSIGSA
jgi:hypothetical protein